jgi:hypothetical protein
MSSFVPQSQRRMASVSPGRPAKQVSSLQRRSASWPSPAIRYADLDGNPATEADPSWLPLLNTPNHPEYPAAHGCFTGAQLGERRRGPAQACAHPPRT